jgi:hypothetical protein
MNDLSPTTRNVLAMAKDKDMPFILLKKNQGSTRADKVFAELLSISEEDLLVCKHEQGILLVRKSSTRQFLV